MGTYYAPLVVNLFLFCYEEDFMMSLSDDIIDELTLHQDIWMIF